MTSQRLSLQPPARPPDGLLPSTSVCDDPSSLWLPPWLPWKQEGEGLPSISGACTAPFGCWAFCSHRIGRKPISRTSCHQRAEGAVNANYWEIRHCTFFLVFLLRVKKPLWLGRWSIPWIPLRDLRSTCRGLIYPQVLSPNALLVTEHRKLMVSGTWASPEHINKDHEYSGRIEQPDFFF